MHIKVFTKYAFQTVMVYDVFKIQFKLKGSTPPKAIVIILDIEAVYPGVSLQHLVIIIRSLWLPFRLND